MITVTFEILIFCPSLNLPPAFVINSFFWRNVIHVCLETWNPRNINQEKAWCKAGSSFFCINLVDLECSFKEYLVIWYLHD